MNDEELQYLVEHYKPSQKVLESLAGAKVIAVVGPSATGKTSIVEMAIKKSPLLGRVGDVTSRPRRPGENDAEFLFLTKEQMVAGIKLGEFVQVAMYPNSDLYATRPQDYPVDKVGILAVQAKVLPIFRRIFPDLKVAYIVPNSYEAWMQWFNQRKRTEEETAKRLEEAKTSLEFAASDQKTNFILNDTLDQAVDRLIQIAEGSKPNDEDQAKQLAAQYLAKLKTQRV